MRSDAGLVSLAQLRGDRTQTGVRGNPDAGTAEQGRQLLAAITESMAEKLADPAVWDAAFPDRGR